MKYCKVVSLHSHATSMPQNQPLQVWQVKRQIAKKNKHIVQCYTRLSENCNATDPPITRQVGERSPSVTLSASESTIASKISCQVVKQIAKQWHRPLCNCNTSCAQRIKIAPFVNTSAIFPCRKRNCQKDVGRISDPVAFNVFHSRTLQREWTTHCD